MFKKTLTSIQTLFFGANDACLPGTSQHVPLEEYKQNLKDIIQHKATLAQKPRILLLTPTPVNEYQLQGFDEGKGNAHPSRTAGNTKIYADAAREVASSTGAVVADIWTAFVSAAGWKEGQPLPGSRDLPEIDSFRALFTDG